MQKIRAFVLGVFCLACSAAGASVIDNIATYDGFDSGPFGETNTATFGQTFVVGSDRYLRSFTMYLNDLEGPSLDFKAYVYRWDSSKATGAQLYSSSVQHLTTTSNVPLAFSFDTGFLELTTGFKYVAFLSTSELTVPEDSSSAIPLDGPLGPDAPDVDGTIADGAFVYFNNGNNFAALTTSIWDEIGPGRDVLFKAVLSASNVPNDVPEPGSFALLGLGLAALAAMRKRKQA